MRINSTYRRAFVENVIHPITPLELKFLAVDVEYWILDVAGTLMR